SHPPVRAAALLTPPATPQFSSLSLHDALPIFQYDPLREELPVKLDAYTSLDRSQGKQYVILHEIDRQPNQLLTDAVRRFVRPRVDRKSTRLNSSHVSISYAVFCLKKKNTLHVQ